MQLLRHDLVFVVEWDSNRLPELPTEQYPRLSLFMPAELRCDEINYGQGEGQVRIEGVEWGFYYADDGSLRVVRHGLETATDADLKSAESTVARICATLSERTGIAFRVGDQERVDTSSGQG